LRFSEIMASTTTIDLFRNTDDFKVYQPGEVIFREGEPGDCMYAVVEGEVAITARGSHVDTIGPGGIFGEMALIDAEPRSATAAVSTTAKVAPINQKRFMFLVQNTPYFSIQVLRIMSERMRRMLPTVNG
jgi:CRP/FNR family cyclic AMP-dependent transcriptional regulator